MSVYIGSSFGYLTLDSWSIAKIIQLATMDFCRRFLNRVNDPCGRQFDQTTQAARAVPANIAEGSARHSTSIETEMRLLDVARASLSEVMDDFLFFLMDNRQAVWGATDPNAVAIRQVRIDPPADTLLSEVTANLLVQKQKFGYWLDNDDIFIRANAIIILCLRLIKILRTQINRRLEEFKALGGFTENMTQSRLEARREMAASQEAPNCPLCGKPMLRRMIRKGQRQGKEFWGCSDYPRCNGTREI